MSAKGEFAMLLGGKYIESIALAVLILSVVGLTFLLYTRPISVEYERVNDSQLIIDSLTKTDADERVHFYPDQAFQYSDVFYISGIVDIGRNITSFLAKANKNGSLEWCILFPTRYSWVDLGHPVTVGSDGYVYLITPSMNSNEGASTNQPISLLKVAPNSTIVLRKDIDMNGTYTWIYSVQFVNSSIYVLGKSTEHNIILTKLSSNGDVEWSITEETTFMSFEYYMAVVGSQVYVIIHETKSLARNALSLIEILKFSSEENNVSHTLVDIGSSSSLQIRDVVYVSKNRTFVILFASNLLQKVSLDGKILAQKKLPKPHECSGYSTISVDPEGNIYALGWYEVYYPGWRYSSGVYLIKLSSSLNFIFDEPIKIAGSDNKLARPAHDALFFDEEGYIYLIYSSGTLQFRWASLLKLKEQQKPAYIISSLLLSVMIISSVGVLIKTGFHKKVKDRIYERFLFKSLKSRNTQQCFDNPKQKF